MIPAQIRILPIRLKPIPIPPDKVLVNNAMKLSPAQVRMLRKLAKVGTEGDRTPFIGGRSAGRTANAWYRTVNGLVDRGLARQEREGDARRAWITDAGMAAINA